ncbi:hypothetical protein NS277_04475 [Novosphingobium barchaimii]|nr:hypothetical protein NS277_04475 [Novosphingobium barchaimii]
MLHRNDASAGTTPARFKLDAAIIASVLAIGTLNVLVMADLIGPSKAYAAAPCRCAPAGIALA